MDNLKIDVLFPYYGDVEMMKKAVNSVRKQTYTNWTLKVFDDGYPSDEPEKFFKRLIDEEQSQNGQSRIFYEKNEKNLGANGNYRKAMEKASSDYFVMMGADDMMHPNFLSTFVSALEKVGNIDIYQPMVETINENDEVYLPLVDKVKRKVMPAQGGVYSGEEIAKSYIHGWHYFPSIIWNTKSAKLVGFNASYDVVQDVNMGLDIIQSGGKLYFVKENTTFSYRRHSKSDSSVRALDGRRFIEEKNFYNEKEAEFEKLGWKKAAKAARHHYFSRLNALSLLPKALKSPKGNVGKLLKHTFNLD